MSDPLSESALDMMELDGVSVGIEDGALEVTCREVTDGEISAKRVFDIGRANHIYAAGASVDLETGAITITFEEP